MRVYQLVLTQSYFAAQQDTPFRPTTIAQLLQEQARDRSDVLALRELLPDGANGREWSYLDLLRDSERLGRALAARHPRGARVAIFANNCPEWVLMEMATALAGLTLVTVNPSYAARELRYVLEQSRAEAIYFVPSVRGTALAPIVDAACADLAQVRHRILLTDHPALFAQVLPFYRVKPLEREVLRARLLALAERAGARVLGAWRKARGLNVRLRHRARGLGWQTRLPR